MSRARDLRGDVLQVGDRVRIIGSHDGCSVYTIIEVDHDAEMVRFAHRPDNRFTSENYVRILSDDDDRSGRS